MEAGMSIQSKVSSMGNTRNSTRRHQPLHTWGLAILIIAHKAYTRAENINGPTGILINKVATFLAPIVYAMQCQCLSVLSLIDHHILMLERRSEDLFPPSAYLFDKIEMLVQVSETVPDKFDDVADKLLMVMHRVPFFDWALSCLITILNFLIVTLTDWGIHVVTEKEIMIDTNSHDHANELASIEERHNDTNAPIHVNDDDSTEDRACTTDSMVGSCEDVTKTKSSFRDILFMEKNEDVCKEAHDKERKMVQPTYKEILEMGTKKETQKKEDGEVGHQSILCKDLKTNERGYEDPILELFATAWHKN
ncbi:hypothetical protein IFM89_035614 [Coptis chinensis]|uniref:Uncharacterized protein n=1 Tax=Coptis chinensis TaxID=261450 RepID=A0A835LU34_9MAGN|nr:hypothetical protein IFM89_035614 [Coptis chinensis]